MILFALSIFKLKIATSYPHEMMVLLTIAVRCFKDWVKFPVSLLRNQSIEFLEMDQTPSNTYQKNIKKTCLDYISMEMNLHVFINFGVVLRLRPAAPNACPSAWLPCARQRSP